MRYTKSDTQQNSMPKNIKLDTANTTDGLLLMNCCIFQRAY